MESVNSDIYFNTYYFMSDDDKKHIEDIINTITKMVCAQKQQLNNVTASMNTLSEQCNMKIMMMMNMLDNVISNNSHSIYKEICLMSKLPFSP